MKTYLVGGAVRDHLLDLPVHERDYVVVGATPAEMSQHGFKPVGKDFPVFLHPKTHEEYALARTEKKVSQGHQGFQFYTAPSITLEEDLRRRDLTINAIAEDEAGNLIDPFQGQLDLKRRVLQHVSDAFAEDPLRILRVARFCAYLGDFDFNVSLHTLYLMRTMVESGVLLELSDERIWQEVKRALETKHPHKFFDVLLEVGAIPDLFTNLDFNPAILKQALDEPLALIRFALLSYKTQYKHVCPKEFNDLAKLSRCHAKQLSQFDILTIPEQITLLHQIDYLRRPNRLEHLIKVTIHLFPNWSTTGLQTALRKLKNLDRASISKQVKTKQDIPDAIFQAECETIAQQD